MLLSFRRRGCQMRMEKRRPCGCLPMVCTRISPAVGSPQERPPVAGVRGPLGMPGEKGRESAGGRSAGGGSRTRRAPGAAGPPRPRHARIGDAHGSRRCRPGTCRSGCSPEEARPSGSSPRASCPPPPVPGPGVRAISRSGLLREEILVALSFKKCLLTSLPSRSVQLRGAPVRDGRRDQPSCRDTASARGAKPAHGTRGEYRAEVEVPGRRRAALRSPRRPDRGEPPNSGRRSCRRAAGRRLEVGERQHLREQRISAASMRRQRPRSASRSVEPRALLARAAARAAAARCSRERDGASRWEGRMAGQERSAVQSGSIPAAGGARDSAR